MAKIWIAGILLASIVVPVAAQQPEEGGLATMTVNGRSEVRVTPDKATVQLGVNLRGTSARQVQEEVNARLNQIIENIIEVGVRKEEIQTSEFNLTPLYANYRPNEVQEPKITGYNAGYTVTVPLTELEKIGPVIDAALQAGANQLQGIRFGLQNEEPIREEALRKAVAQARRKAELLAQAAGVRLIRLLQISESGVSIRPPVMFSRALAGEAADTSTPVLPGQINVEAGVMMRYEIGGQ